MANEEKRPLKVFLCHASGDKPAVRDLYRRLTVEGVDAWLDQEKLLPGQDWRMEIPRAVREADVVVICLSKKSITKEGYVQREIRFALDSAEEKPDGAIFLIPARLEDCVVPERLNRWQWVDLYDDNGFIKLLRSIKLRADAVGATVEPVSYVFSKKEADRKLEQLYTEGLAAFYTEDWDKACQRFQTILSERPNHRNAAEKLAQAERQRNLAKLYRQATSAVQSEDWGSAIRVLEELSKKSTDYKDAAQLLRDARKQKQLNGLYAEAKALHFGKQWAAVVKVFEQISSIDPDYSDKDDLLASAKKEAEELDRLAELNEQYGHALREMDLGNWHDARSLLEQIHKSETGFLETEKLLKKVEDEIVREEEKRNQNDEINTLYEQAHGLLRSKKWRNALDKMDEIHKLDDRFPDTDGIAEKAQKELDNEEQEAERQNKLAALYAEAVKFLKDEKYQEALDKWQEVRVIDSKYPDRQRVGKTAKKNLGGQTQITAVFSPGSLFHNLRVEWLVILAALGFGLTRFVHLSFFSNYNFGWSLTGFLQGLVTALVIQKIIPEWKWKVLFTFSVCWAIIYPITRIVIVETSMPILIDIAYASAPALSIIISSIWMRRRMHWSTYILIFAGWTLAWLIGQSVADYIIPIFQGSSFRWVFSDIFAGGIGLWITVDLLRKKSVEDSSESEAVSQTGSEQLLLWAFLGTMIIRAIWGIFQDWFHIWDDDLVSIPQFIFLFALGVCYGAVVVFSLKKVIPGWKLNHSLIVICGWALGFGLAILAVQVDLNFDAVLMAVSGLSMAVALKLVRPSMSSLKIALIFVAWTMAKIYGGLLGNYLGVTLATDYVWIFADAITILLGLLATLGIYEYASERLIKLTLISIAGFALGNYIGSVLIRSLSLSLHIEVPMQYAMMGFFGCAVFESPSRNLKKILIKGGLGAVSLVVGYFLGILLPISYISLRNIILGAMFGIVFGLPARKVSIVSLLVVLGSAIFMISSIYISNLNYTYNSEAIIRGALIGLVMGFGYAYVTMNMETVTGNTI